MNLNKKIGVLLDNGFEPKFISSLTESKINFLFEKMSKRKEAKEQESDVLKVPKGSDQEKQAMAKKQAFVAYENEIKEDEFYTDISGTDQEPIQKSGPDYPGSDRGTTSSLDEKFESKAQQGLFWARCKKCKTDDCKWCKMAKDFSDKTSKKQYKTIPEKKHLEKTVKYKKKKETNEEFTMSNYYDKVASVYANNAMGKLTKEQIMNKHLTKLVESTLNPTMKKKDLLKLIESEIKSKESLNEDFYYDEIDEKFDMDMDMSYDEDSDWEEEVEPNWYEWDTEEDTPGPRGKLKMNNPYEMPTIEPGIKEPKIRPKREIEPEWEPDFDEPIIPDEDTEAEPQARKKLRGVMTKIREEFNRDLNRLDNVNHKPINYRKY
jgi:hypothetical protein